MHVVRCACLIVLLALAGCGTPPKLPQRAVSRLYMPLVAAAPTKFGVAGCGCARLGCSWCYGWSPWPGQQAGVEAVPMLRDASNVQVTRLGGNSVWLMGFNEPDLCPEQACLTPLQAAQLWREIEAKWPDRRLVAPAPSHVNPDWLPQFREAYLDLYGRPPRLDALAAHCYLRYASQCTALVGLFVAWAEAWGVGEVWVTEFAFLPAYTFGAEYQARKFVAWLEVQPQVTRYAPYVVQQIGCDEFWPDCRPDANPSLLTVDGRATEIGGWYAKPLE